jgi:hypothetical protein
MRQISLTLQLAGGTEVRLNRALTVFAASLIAFAPFQAFAQDANENVSVRDRPRPEYDPLGLRFGGFDLNANLDAGVASTDNLFATQTNEDSDTIYTLSPSARLASHWSRNSLQLAAGLTHTAHQDFTSEDSDTGYVSGRGRLDIGANTQVSADAQYARQVESRTDPDATTVGGPVEYNVKDANVAVTQTFNRIRASVGIGRTEYDYHSQAFRNSSDNDINMRVDAAISPRIALVAETTLDKRDYDNDPGLSSNGRTYLVGASFNLTDLLHGELTAGEFDRDYDSGPHVKGAAVSGNLEWYITRLTTLNFNASRSAQDLGQTAVPYIETTYGAHVDHELLRNVILSAGIQAGQHDYRLGVDRTDDFVYGELGAEYILNRRVALNARFVHDEVNSSGVDRYRDYDVNTLSVGLSLRL